MTQRSLLTALGFAGLAVVLGLLIYLNLEQADRSTPEEVAGEGSRGQSAAGVASASPTVAEGYSRTAAAPRPSRDDRLVGEDLRAAPSPSPSPSGSSRRVLLYFQGVDVGLLFAEERDIELGLDGNTQARAVIAELTKGPTKDLLPTIPKGTRLREVYFDSTGVAYVDFSSELRDNHPGGSAEELMTVESIVNTLTRNVPQVQAVRFLVDGRPIDTLAGHVNLASPLRPSSDRLALGP